MKEPTPEQFAEDMASDPNMGANPEWLADHDPPPPIKYTVETEPKETEAP